MMQMRSPDASGSSRWFSAISKRFRAVARAVAMGAGFRTAAISGGVLLLPGPALAETPLSYLHASGERADAINTLLWYLIYVSLAVIVLTAVLIIGGLFRGRTFRADTLPGFAPVVGAGGGVLWIAIGTGVSVVVLFASTVWTVVTLAQVSFPPAAPGGEPNLKLQVIGHQWWWEVHYLDDNVARRFSTANEIHIPVRRPVEVELSTTDVIHSFWIPALNGKTDLIPGQRNTTWFAASKPGVYRGQCTEYCGRQHAHMAMEAVAESPGEFKTWWDHQLEDAPSADTESSRTAQDIFVLKCGICHTVRGTRAGGIIGPDLSHLMTRKTIAAATLRNTIGNLSAWIADPQHIKPGNLMPEPDISGPQLAAIRSFLETLE